MRSLIIMTDIVFGAPKFSGSDLDFVVDTAAPTARNKQSLKRFILEDESFRKALLEDKSVLEKVVTDEEVFLKISPALYFEILLRRSLKEMETATHTIERTGKQNIPIFDAREVVELLTSTEVLYYLAQMLASFTRINSYVFPMRTKRGTWRRVRYNDMDIDSLLKFCSQADDEERFGFYKRIADICLFVTGVFPDYTFFNYGHSVSVRARPPVEWTERHSRQDYEQEGRWFYGLAQKHPVAEDLHLSEVFGLLHDHFSSARKPLSFIATHYLHSSKQQLFGAPSK